MASKNTNGNYGRPGSTFPQEVQDEVIRLCEQGVARNVIARQLGIGTSSVSGIVKRAGLSFDRSRIKAATTARTVDLRARRSKLAERLVIEAEKLLDEMHEPHLAFAFGGKENEYNEHLLDKPPVEAKRHLMMTASVALQRHMDLERHDADEKADAAKSMLIDLAKAIGVQAPDAGA